MQVVTIDSEAYQGIIEMFKAIFKRLEEKEKDAKKEWMDQQEFLLMMKISKRTAQHYRDSGIIPFSQVGSKIYYKRTDVEELLKTHYKKAFKKP